MIEIKGIINIMKTSVKISIIEKNDEVSAIFLGTIEYRPEGYYLEYDDGNENHCIIGYSKGVATITKTSEPAYTLILEEERPHLFNISTPFGEINAYAYPTKVSSRKNKGIITLTLQYELTIGNEKLRQELKMKIEEV